MKRRLASPIVAVTLAALAAAGGEAARAEPLVADLSSHLVAITTGFTGTSVTLFGATDAPSDVIVLVRGPERDVVVRHKSSVAGLWINTREMTFAAVPSYYAIFANRPLDEIAPPALRTSHQIGIASLRIAPIRGETGETALELPTFHRALLDEHIGQGLYDRGIGRVNFLGEHLFRATIPFPANVPTGNYRIEVLLIRNRAVVAAQTTPLVVSQVGVNADIAEFADRWAPLYGLLAVTGAGLAGWLASLPFRNA